MDIDDALITDADAAEGEDSMMAVDSSQPPLGAAGEDATISDAEGAAAGDGGAEAEGDAEMSDPDALARGGEEERTVIERGEDEVMLVEEEGGAADGDAVDLESVPLFPVEAGASTPLASAIIIEAGAQHEGDAAVATVPAPAPSLDAVMIGTDAASGATGVQADTSTHPVTWPPAPTDLPAVPSRLPDALSAATYAHPPVDDASAEPGAHAEADVRAGAGLPGVETASVKAEPAESVAPTEMGGPTVLAREAADAGLAAGPVNGLMKHTISADDSAANGAPADHVGEPDVAQEDEDEDEQEDEGADFDEDTTEDLLPPILLHFGAAVRPLFFPLPGDVDIDVAPAEGEAEAAGAARTGTGTGAALNPDPLLVDRADDLLFTPLEVFFGALRSAAGDDWAEDKHVDMVLEQKDVQLIISENDKQTTHLTLNDIVALHARLGCPTPLSLYVTARPENFYRRYRMILAMLDEREMSEPLEDGEGEEHLETHDETYGEEGVDIERADEAEEEGEDELEEGEYDEEEGEQQPGHDKEEGEAAQEGAAAGLDDFSSGVGASQQVQASGSLLADADPEAVRPSDEATSADVSQATADPASASLSGEAIIGGRASVASQAESAVGTAEPKYPEGESDAQVEGHDAAEQGEDILEEEDELDEGDNDQPATPIDQADGLAETDLGGALNGKADGDAVEAGKQDVNGAPYGVVPAHAIVSPSQEKVRGTALDDAAESGEIVGKDEYHQGKVGKAAAEEEGADTEEEEHDMDEHAGDTYGLKETVAAAEREADALDGQENVSAITDSPDAPSPRKRPLDEGPSAHDAARNVKRKVSGSEETVASSSAHAYAA